MKRLDESQVDNLRNCLSAVGLRPGHDGIAKTQALFLQPVEQAPGPHEFRRQHPEREHDGNPAGAGRDDHHYSQREQREPEKDFQETPGLLERPE